MQYDFLQESIEELAIEVAGSECTSLRSKNIVKSAARVFDQGQVSSASFVGDCALDDLLDQARRQTGGAIPYSYPLPSGKEGKEWTAKSDKTDVFDYLRCETEEVLENLRADYPHFIFSGKNTVRRVTRTFENSLGVRHQVSYDAFDQGFLIKRLGSPNIADSYIASAGIGTSNLRADVARNRPYLDVFDREVSIRAGKHPVIVPSPEGLLLGRLLESARIDKYRSGSVLFKDQLSKSILSEQFSLSDWSWDPKRGVVNPFDGEGVERENPKLPIVEKGRFMGLIADLRNSAKFGVNGTGNGQRDVGGGVHLDFLAPVIEPGTRTMETVAKEDGDCVYLGMAAGANCALSGQLGTPANLAYLMQDGKPVGRLPQMGLSGNIKRLLGEDLLAIAADGPSEAGSPYVITKMDVAL